MLPDKAIMPPTTTTATTTTTNDGAFPISHKTTTLLSPPPHSYDYSISTTEAYEQPDAPFIGAFSNIRLLLDYSYHAHYTPQRQHVQDTIIHFFLHYHHSDDDKTLFPPHLPPPLLPPPPPIDCPLGHSPRGPWVVFTAGPMGAGKSHSLKWMARRGYFPLDKFVHVSRRRRRRRRRRKGGEEVVVVVVAAAAVVVVKSGGGSSSSSLVVPATAFQA